MTGAQFTRLLQAAELAAMKHKEHADKITEAFEARYGLTYSEANMDNLIDALDYGFGWAQGNLTATKVDKAMAEAGHPKLEEE